MRKKKKRKKEIEILTIDEESILPGESATVNINIGRLPAGTSINMPIHVFRSKIKGPTIMLSAGVHGDEINSIEAIRRCVFNEYFDDLKCGTIVAIPIVNIYGFINFSRHVPDGKDVNRSFPGTLNGSLASRVARIITSKILPHIDYIIDLHTGGAQRYNYPQIRYTAADKVAYDLAKIFGAPYIIKKSLLSGSLRKIAHQKEIPTIVYEGGESLRFDGLAIEHAINGIKRITNHFGMTHEKVIKPLDSMLFDKSSWIRASIAGIFLWSKRSGHPVQKGEPLGVINDAQGFKRVIVVANRSGYIISHNNASVVNQGDALFAIAYHHDSK